MRYLYFSYILIFILSYSYSYEKKYISVIDKIPHHPNLNFTQGLTIYENKLYETTGLIEKSAINVYDLKTKKIISSKKIENNLFGEGSTIFNEKIYLLTWKKQKVFIYDLNTFKKKLELPIPTKEGWGLTVGKNGFWLSDGSNKLYLLDQSTFKIIEIHEIFIDDVALENINELEYVNGLIFFNVWFLEELYVYDINNKKIIQKIDTTPIQNMERKAILSERNNVINGIAFNEENKLFYLTGKRWEYIYIVQIKDNNT